MGAKRVLLIAGGTIGGLGAVLSITPPQFGTASSGGLGGHLLGGGSTTSTASTTATTPAPAATQAASTPAPAATATKKATATTPAPAATTAAPAPAPAKAKPSGTFTGSTSQTRFGPVQVQITLVNGKITAANALQYPNNDFRSQQISQQAIPYLVQETLAANSANIQGVGGASYTSQGWYDSLVSALAKAGM
jgi:uncharacterized protein with FMN-binding domain